MYVFIIMYCFILNWVFANDFHHFILHRFRNRKLELMYTIQCDICNCSLELV